MSAEQNEKDEWRAIEEELRLMYGDGNRSPAPA